MINAARGQPGALCFRRAERKRGCAKKKFTKEQRADVIKIRLYGLSETGRFWKTIFRCFVTSLDHIICFFFMHTLCEINSKNNDSTPFARSGHVIRVLCSIPPV